MFPLIFVISLPVLVALAIHYRTPTGELLVSCQCRGDWVASKSECREAHAAGQSQRCYKINKEINEYLESCVKK